MSCTQSQQTSHPALAQRAQALGLQQGVSEPPAEAEGSPSLQTSVLSEVSSSQNPLPEQQVSPGFLESI
jgi:hypothetical protein